MVAVDDNGIPCKVPPLIINNEIEQRWHDNAKMRKETLMAFYKNQKK